MTYQLTHDERADIARWVSIHRPERITMLHTYTGELDPDEEPYGDPVGYRTPSDNRIRAMFWFVVMPGFYAGLGVIAWAVWQVIRRVWG